MASTQGSSACTAANEALSARPRQPALISDWALTRGGRTYGHYTTRVVIASLPAEEQAQYAGLLATFAEGLP